MLPNRPSCFRRLLTVLLLVIASLGLLSAAAAAQERAVAPASLVSAYLAGQSLRYERGGSLGFTLRDTSIAEELYTYAAIGGRGVIWNASFASPWALTEDQLARWHAQASGLLAEELAAEARLDGWQLLEVEALGDRQVACRYALATAEGRGELALGVYARGAAVTMLGVASLGATPVETTILLRQLAGEPTS